jgi:hypothetical protein
VKPEYLHTSFDRSFYLVVDQPFRYGLRLSSVKTRPDMPIEGNYKNDFFRLLRHVHDNGLYRQGLTGESLRERLSERWKTRGDNKKGERDPFRVDREPIAVFLF